MNLTEAQYQEYVKKIRDVCRDEGIDYILDKYDADVIIGPADSTLSTIASGSGERYFYLTQSMYVADLFSGYPIAGMPLGYLDIKWQSIRHGCYGKETSRGNSA